MIGALCLQASDKKTRLFTEIFELRFLKGFPHVFGYIS